MPRIVDHEKRRVEIAKVVSALVVKGGADAVTIRAVAEACGYSTTIVCHYFRSKHEMLSYTQRIAWERGLLRMRKAARAGKGLAECLDHALPNTEARWHDWLCWLTFWGQSPSTAGVAQEWADSLAASAAVFVDLVTAAQKRGEFDPAADPAEVAIEIQLLVNGIATLVAQVRAQWPASRQREMLHRQLARLGYRPPATEA